MTLAGRVRSWSPTVDRSDSGTVGRSQAGRLPTESSVGTQTCGRGKNMINYDGVKCSVQLHLC